MRRFSWLRVSTHLLGLAPLVTLAWALATNRLGPDPVGEAARRAGRYALIFLFLSLLPTALYTVAGEARLLRVRRALGLYAFLYATLHLLVFLGLDYAFDWRLIVLAVSESPFVLLGLAALIILAPLAVTSTNGWVRRLGRNWGRLHRLVYAAAALAVVHYAAAFKELRLGPLAVGLVLGLLFVLRIPVVARWFVRQRSNRRTAGADRQADHFNLF